MEMGRKAKVIGGFRHCFEVGKIVILIKGRYIECLNC